MDLVCVCVGGGGLALLSEKENIISVGSIINDLPSSNVWDNEWFRPESANVADNPFYVGFVSLWNWIIVICLKQFMNVS